MSRDLSNPNAVRPTLAVDVPGDFVIQLVVHDGIALSAPDVMVVSTLNTPPVANAGADSRAFVGDTVTLDGTASTDVDGDSLTYAWSLSSGPEGSSAQLTQTNAIRPSFTADRPGTYVAQLIVSDAWSASAPDTVTVTTENSPPVAKAGAAQTVLAGQTVVLDGTQSHDVDGDAITFRWAMTSRPASSTATLSSPTRPRPSFVVDRAGTYVVQLIVNDGIVDSARRFRDDHDDQFRPDGVRRIRSHWSGAWRLDRARRKSVERFGRTCTRLLVAP